MTATGAGVGVDGDKLVQGMGSLMGAGLGVYGDKSKRWVQG